MDGTVIQNLPTAGQDSANIYAPTATNVAFGSEKEQPELVQVRLPNGEVVLMNPVTKQVYVPNLLNAPPGERDTTF